LTGVCKSVTLLCKGIFTHAITHLAIIVGDIHIHTVLHVTLVQHILQQRLAEPRTIKAKTILALHKERPLLPNITEECSDAAWLEQVLQELCTCLSLCIL
jgi:hypothetical protein